MYIIIRQNFIRIFFIFPSITLPISQPQDNYHQLSTSKDLSLFVFSDFGCGKNFTIPSRILSIPSPVFPEQLIASEVSIPSSISFGLSMSDAGGLFYSEPG